MSAPLFGKGGFPVGMPFSSSSGSGARLSCSFGGVTGGVMKNGVFFGVGGNSSELPKKCHDQL